MLADRLESIGIEASKVPYLMRDITNSFTRDLSMDLIQLKDNLVSLGWDDVELDYRTYEIAREYFEINELRSYENRDRR